MASFMDIDTNTKEPRKYFQKDWSVVEQQFKNNLKAFITAISIANKLVEAPTCEGVDIKEVVLHTEKYMEKNKEILTKEKEETAVRVEYSDIEKPKEGSLIIEPVQPAQPKETCLNSPDAFDDIFGSSTTEKKCEQVSEAPTTQSSQPCPSLGDAFVSKSYLTPVQAKAVLQSVDCDIFASAGSSSPAKLLDNEGPIASPAYPDKTEDPFSQGFDFARFADISKIAEGVIAKVDLDLDQIDKEYKEYAIEYSADAYRANVNSLADCVAQVQAKKDRVNTVLIKLTSLREGMRYAEDFYSSFGLMCSNASSKEKRLAQVKYHLRDFYTELATVDRLHAMYEQAERGLNKQTETLSRLITVHLGGNRPEFNRASLPPDQGSLRHEVATSPAMSRSPRPVSKRGLEGLEDFESNPVIPKDRNKGTEEVDF